MTYSDMSKKAGYLVLPLMLTNIDFCSKRLKWNTITYGNLQRYVLKLALVLFWQVSHRYLLLESTVSCCKNDWIDLASVSLGCSVIVMNKE